MKIVIAGSRGIPANYGGFETFAEELGVNLQARGPFEVTVICDADQQKKNNNLEEFKGVRLLYSKYAKARNPIQFYLDSFTLGIKHSDIILSCGVGGGYWAFLPRLFGKVVVTNPDGIGWRRSKWGLLEKLALRTMYFFSASFSDYYVCDSAEITKIIREKYSFDRTYTIEYGAYKNEYLDVCGSEVSDVLRHYGLESKRYHLVVSRLEPENNVDVIVDGYSQEVRKYPLVIVGNLQDTNFVKKLQASANGDVVFLDGIYDKEHLAIVRANALDYIHGHSVGGTNPSLLEALASANLCLCHDNIFNREVVGELGFFFDSAMKLSSIIGKIEDSEPSEFKKIRDNCVARITNYYNWDSIAEKYSHAFEQMLMQKRKGHG